MFDRKIKNQFPRTRDFPSQSSKYWAKEKDRLIRQLLIADIEVETNRELVVYFARLDQPIVASDADDLLEVLEGTNGSKVDLLIHTPGGIVDAVEKFVTVLRKRVGDYRVIVPALAKSGGTVIAISSSEIIFGVNSELGPIDPQLVIPDYGIVPAEFLIGDETMPPIYKRMAKTQVGRMRKLAEKYLNSGMLKGAAPKKIEEVVAKLASPDSYGSHGAVIDFDEARDLGLSVRWLDYASSLWKRIWLLYCIYDHDIARAHIGKIVEGANNSITRQPLLIDSQA